MHIDENKIQLSRAMPDPPWSAAPDCLPQPQNSYCHTELFPCTGQSLSSTGPLTSTGPCSLLGGCHKCSLQHAYDTQCWHFEPLAWVLKGRLYVNHFPDIILMCDFIIPVTFTPQPYGLGLISPHCITYSFASASQNNCDAIWCATFVVNCFPLSFQLSFFRITIV